MNIIAHLCADPQGRLGVLRSVPHTAQLIVSGEAPSLVVVLVYTAERRPDCRRVPGYAEARSQAERADCITRYRAEVSGLLAAMPRRAA